MRPVFPQPSSVALKLTRTLPLLTKRSLREDILKLKSAQERRPALIEQHHPSSSKWLGLTIYDDKVNALFKVIVQGCVGMAGPIYEAVISGINTREPVAYARKDIADFRETHYINTAIQTTTANYQKFAGRSGQEFLCSRYSETLFKNYVCKRYRQEFKLKTTIKAESVVPFYRV
jgi:hypothetical protein